jgi:hypothetical protein
LDDWGYIECRMQDAYRSASWKIPDNTKAFRLIDLGAQLNTMVVGNKYNNFPPGQGVSLPLRVGVQVPLAIKLIWTCPFLV